jgi:hypothetical protein
MERKELELKNVATVQEFQDNVSYLSNVRLIIMPVKLWAQSENLKEPNYGVTWRIEKVEVEPKASTSNSLNHYQNNDAFIDSDEDDDNEVTLNENSNDGDNDDDDDDDDDESESESEESEDEKPPSPVLKKKKNKKQNA